MNMIKSFSLNSFQIKILALIFMVMDHAGTFLLGTSTWLNYIGRLAAPLFMFILVWGMDYTHSRKKYLLRLYLFSLLMIVIWQVEKYINPFNQNDNNIFSTLFVIAAFIALLSPQIKLSIWKKILIIVVWQGISTYLCRYAFPSNISNSFGVAIGQLTGNMFYCDGGFLWVVLGVLLYYIKNSKKSLIIGYSAFCVLYELNSMTAIIKRIVISLTYHGYLYEPFTSIIDEIYFLIFREAMFMTPLVPHEFYFGDYQWLMIFSLPIMLMYNHKPGRKWKWFFYIFYPLHCIILLTISAFM